MGASVPSQPSLFDWFDRLDRGDRRAPAVDVTALARARRTSLDETAWVEHLPDWVRGQELLMDDLVRGTAWHSERRYMYDRTVDVPRLVAALPDDGPGHPLLDQIREALAAHYGTASRASAWGTTATARTASPGTATPPRATWTSRRWSRPCRWAHRAGSSCDRAAAVDRSRSRWDAAICS